MNPVNLLLGVAAVGYGAYTAWARQTRPEQFSKLEAMKETWGEGAGQAVHIVGYTVVPVIVGGYLIVSGLRGASF
jgi:hypothetical protein